MLEAPSIKNIMENIKPETDSEEEILGSVRLYGPEEYSTLFEEAGLVFEKRYSEGFLPYSPGSKRFILVARKQGHMPPPVCAPVFQGLALPAPCKWRPESLHQENSYAADPALWP